MYTYIKTIQRLFILLFATSMCVSCMEDNYMETVNNFSITVEMPEELEQYFYANQTISLLQEQVVKYTAITDEKGVATFTGIIPDVYDISTSWTIKGMDYMEMIEEETENKDVVISASKTGILVTANTGNLSLTGLFSIKQSILISKVYFTGRKKTSSGNMLYDRYIELFNNSDEDVALDQLYLALTETEATKGYYAYDETRVDNYIYTKQIFQIPGTGNDYILAPGESALIVNSAADHGDEGGFDLTDANFEAKSQTFTNNIDVPALTLVHSYTSGSGGLAINFMNTGYNAFIIFRTDEDVSTWPLAYANGSTSGSQYCAVDPTLVIDGVEMLQNKTSGGPDKSMKHLYDFIDAGYQYSSASAGYNGEVAVRRTERYEDGRYYLADTNNTSDDFVMIVDQLPRTFLDPDSTETEE